MPPVPADQSSSTASAAADEIPIPTYSDASSGIASQPSIHHTKPKPDSMSSALPLSMGAFRILLALLALIVALVAAVSLSAAPPACTPLDQPNPIANDYPYNATGLLNVTLAVIPIPLSFARTLIPPQWPILVHVYQALFAALGVSEEVFPPDHYPLMVQAGLDHDIQMAAYKLSISDFQRAGYEFPFVDRLGDNHSSFRWVPHQIITASNADAVEGSRAYGTLVSPSESFDPPCDAYRWLGHYGGTTNFKAYARNSTSIRLSFYHTYYSPPALPLDLFRNMTNQPSFANGTACDNQIRLFNTAHFFGTGNTNLAAHPVRGSVTSANFAPLNGMHTWGGNVHGWQLATPFIENNYLDCDDFKGYDGVDLPGY
ncbi:hypothetical protein SPBR_05116 [Sporothrix brasiliensis 5110]|uniref:Uncharacterized protein n=1 Tax=Sporothrix brasiliensis 5110 TaxID=1398154 RepID=A0A0C2ISF4_9PEZI|nr:uncharacterized protein SPBR_05116 [Sporothrix brasiliensis 5110]KIH87932.1 hypothetical protein SPBR_05116 [Sporothrix brasiliensis 5110]